MADLFEFAVALMKAQAELLCPETKREEQVRKTCEKVKRTGKREDLAYYLKMRREDNDY